jgi:protein TonB
MNSDSIKHSFLIHFFLVGIFVLFTMVEKRTVIETFEFSIQEEVKVVKKRPKIVINAQKAAPKQKVKKKARQVYGINRKSQTSESGESAAKLGNTLAKKEDDKKLRKDDPDNLPAPAEEYLITAMPRAEKEVRPLYPGWAKKEQIQGSVIFDILIDSLGRVREAKLLKGLHPELDELAKQAMLQFRFRPAKVEKKSVAVRIKYAIRFILE